MANHASHAALPYPIRGARFTLLLPYLDDDGDPTDPTTPDTEVSKDDGSAADAAEEVSSPKNSIGMLTLTGAETDAAALGIAAKAASGPKTTLATLYPRQLAVVGSGTLSAGSAGGGTLGTLLAYDVTGCFIKTTGGTGGGGTGGANNQARKIITYNTSTGAFTVAPNWETTPSTDTTYDVLLPEGVTLGMLRTLNPATAGRTLQVEADGMAHADLKEWKASAPADLTDTDKVQASLENIPDGAITAAKLADGLLTAAKFATGAITSAKIAADAIGASQLSTAAVAKIEAALLNEGDGQALIDAIVQAIDAADIENDVLPALIRDAILNRSLAGNHDTAGTVGFVLQHLDADISGRASQTSVDDLPTNAELATALAAADDAVLAAIAALNNLSSAEAQAAALAALVSIHLDHLLSATYDPASKPGAADALLNELVENDGGLARFTANTLEAGPGGSASVSVTFNVVPSIVSGGDVASGDITAYLSAKDTRSIVVVDQDGDAISLSGETLIFCVEIEGADATDLFTKTTADGITIGGAGNNVATIAYDAADVPTAGNYLYSLRRAGDTEGKVFAEGKWIVKRAALLDAA